jgi:hypothetical protein
MTRASLTATLSLLLLMSLVSEQAGRGLQTLRQAALDHVREWCGAQAERIEQALHLNLAQLAVSSDPRTGEGEPEQVSAARGRAFGDGAWPPAPGGTRPTKITLRDLCGGAAGLKVDLDDWIDCIRLSHIDGRWVVVEVSWRFTPGAKKKYYIPTEYWLDRP